MKLTLVALLFSFTALAQELSTLPILMIDTQGSQVVDEPKIRASLKLIDNGDGQTNSTSDSAVFEGAIGIEYRGSSSQQFPKKPYGFETWDDNNEDLAVSFFGWPEESDWILFASYNEKSLMHNVLTMRMAREMGLYASRTKYVELYLNGNYEGVYVLMEKVKRDKGRVDIAKLTEDEESGHDLTGGYIVKIDKNTGSSQGSWSSNYGNIDPYSNRTNFFYEYPNNITANQKSYIRDYITDFEDALYSLNPKDDDGYKKFIDLKSFVQVTLINEVAKNVDGYRISTFLYKDKDSKGGRLKMGPPWDYDISYGNADYCEGWLYTGFSYDFNKVCPNDYWLVPFWWEKFLQDPEFISLMRLEYDNLRKDGILNEANLMGLVDEIAETIRMPQQRNFERWPILGTYVWPSPSPIAENWEGEVTELKNWISNRLKWLDENLPREVQILAVEDELMVDINAYPNPFTNGLTLDFNNFENESPLEIQVFNSQGKLIISETKKLTKYNSVVNLRFDQPQMHQEMFVLRINAGGKSISRKLVRQ
ncbi:CotH kinase family protein [Jiulongibacter sp. NS-SX5]|uniref:CotH kinase family protein n=1 Tax=Jiulongibacter sp. NS-SX5 TaxID=3463854 RepID=UPI004059C172